MINKMFLETSRQWDMSINLYLRVNQWMYTGYKRGKKLKLQLYSIVFLRGLKEHNFLQQLSLFRDKQLRPTVVNTVEYVFFFSCSTSAHFWFGHTCVYLDAEVLISVTPSQEFEWHVLYTHIKFDAKIRVIPKDKWNAVNDELSLTFPQQPPADQHFNLPCASAAVCVWYVGGKTSASTQTKTKLGKTISKKLTSALSHVTSHMLASFHLDRSPNTVKVMPLGLCAHFPLHLITTCNPIPLKAVNL